MTALPRLSRRALSLLLLMFCAVFALTACGSGSGSDDESSSGPSSAESEGQWPRTFTDDDGHEVTLDEAPERIVSTSVTLTGSLLAIESPVVASGGAAPDTNISDAQGFFTQWSSVAEERGVKSLYTGDPSAEKVLAEDPDLIIIAKVGGDSAIDLYDQLSEVAPTAVIDYSTQDWETISSRLGELTGHENKAEEIVSAFDDRAAQIKDGIDRPAQPVTGLVYNKAAFGESSGGNIWTGESAQGRLLEKVGFTLADVPEDTRGSGQLGQREDIYQIDDENLSRAVTGETVFLFASDESSVDLYKEDPLLGNTPAVQNDAVYALGDDSFRLDYYSASNVLDRIEEQFGN